MKNAYFSIRVAPESQFWFAFSYRGQRYTFARLAQGYKESASVFNEALVSCLSTFTPPAGSTIISYVDDVLIASPSKNACREDTIALLNFLASVGLKVDKQKLQLVQDEVKYLGHILTPGCRALDASRISAITSCPRPKTKQQMLRFLGMVGYCRAWILNYAERAKTLQACTNACNKLTDNLTLTDECENAFVDLKNALSSAPALGLPNYDLPFHLFVCDKAGYMSGVLTQSHGGQYRPVAYVSKQLDPVARGFIPCMKAVAATASAVLACGDIVLFHPLTVHVPHEVQALLLQAKNSHLTPACLLSYQHVLLTLSHVTLTRCTKLNPATMLPTAEDGDEHDCCGCPCVLNQELTFLRRFLLTQI